MMMVMKIMMMMMMVMMMIRIRMKMRMKRMKMVEWFTRKGECTSVSPGKSKNIVTSAPQHLIMIFFMIVMMPFPWWYVAAYDEVDDYGHVVHIMGSPEISQFFVFFSLGWHTWHFGVFGVLVGIHHCWDGIWYLGFVYNIWYLEWYWQILAMACTLVPLEKSKYIAAAASEHYLLINTTSWGEKGKQGKPVSLLSFPPLLPPLPQMLFCYKKNTLDGIRC